MGINRVEYDGNILIDLTSDSVTPETLVKGVIAHNAAGDEITGTLKVVNTPDYVIDEAKETAGKVLSHQSEDSFTLAWLSDIHIGNKYEVDDKWISDESSNIEAGQGLHEITKTVPLDLIALGGDLACGASPTSRTDGLSQLDTATEYMRPATFYTPTLYLVGNHDDAPFRDTANRVTRAELHSRFGRKNLLIGAVSNNADKGCNYGYKDFENRRMRVIYLDTHDKNGWESTNVEQGSTSSPYMDACNISAKQLDWLANKALDFRGKDNPSGWGVIICSHTQLDIVSGTRTYTDSASGNSYEYNTDNVITVLTAYLSKGSGSITLNGETATYDFTAKPRAQLYCCINGHRHCYEFREYGVKKIPAITCPNTRNGSERVSFDGNTYAKTPGTGESCSFNVITVDRKNGKIYADNHGAGIDRAFDVVIYAAYTNLVLTSLDTDLTTVFNGSGYQNGMYVDGYSVKSQTGYVSTGIMSYGAKSDGTRRTIYVKGATLDTTKRHVCCTLIQNLSGLYASHYCVGGTTNDATKWSTYFNIETLGTDYYKLTPIDSKMGSNVSLIRMSFYGTGEKLVVTLDEPIEDYTDEDYTEENCPTEEEVQSMINAAIGNAIGGIY